MDTSVFTFNNDCFFCSAETLSQQEIGAFIAACTQGTEELRVNIPEKLLKQFEAAGFCTDGVRFKENGVWRYIVHRSAVFDGCQRLEFDPDAEAVYTRTAFSGAGVKEATLHITALGYFEPFMNGERLTEDQLIPPKSDYVQRDLSTASYPIYDTMSHRIYYYTYDLTPRLNPGENVVAAHVGSGWFGDTKNTAEGMRPWGRIFLIFKLILKDAAGNETEICSDASNTKWHRSHVLETALYYGEYHDYRKYIEGWNDAGLDDADWKKPTPAPLPHTFFMQPDFPSDRTCGEITPVLIEKRGDRSVYDLGETASGWPVLVRNDKTEPNGLVTLRYADALTEENGLDFQYTGGLWRAQRDAYVFARHMPCEELHPHFLWHAARYVELTGEAELKTFVKVQTPIQRVSKFKSSSEILNWFFTAYTNTQEANVHGSIPSDCPHRERLGYTGDGQLTCGAVMSVYDARDFYKKWMRDIRDCQDIKNGHVQHTAPFFGGGGGPGGWGGAAVIVPYRYYQFYADKEALRLAYPSMKGYIDYMLTRCEANVVVREEDKGWCLGDWCTPGNKNRIPEAYVNTYFFIKCAEMCAKTAEILDVPADAPFFTAVAETLKKGVCSHFYDESTGSFCGGVEGADAFAVDIGLGDARTLQNLVNKYETLGTLDTGIFGTDILTRVLFREGYGSLAYRLLTNKGEVSFFNMKKHGAMNLWEEWDGVHSRCHPMFGAVTEYFFSDILGIRRFEGRPGYADVIIAPAEIPELENVSGTMGTPWGNITVVIGTDENGRRNVSYLADPRITVHSVD